MLDAFIKLTEKIIELGKEKSNRRIMLFEKHAEPMFGLCRVVHDDYIDAFKEIETYLVSSTSGINESLDFLKKRREDCLSVRREIFEYCYQLEQQPPKCLLPFVIACRALLNASPDLVEGVRWHPSDYTCLAHNLELLSRKDAHFSTDVNYRLELLNRFRLDVTQSWEKVKSEYFKLKVDCYK